MFEDRLNLPLWSHCVEIPWSCRFMDLNVFCVIDFISAINTLETDDFACLKNA